MKRALTSALLALCLLGCDAPQAEPAISPPGDPPLPPAQTEEPTEEPTAELKLTNSREPVPDRTLEAWLSALATRGDEGFRPAHGANTELALYLVESMATTGFCLKESVDPHRGGRENARWSARVSDGTAPDSLRAVWTAEGLEFTLTETANCLLVEAKPTAKPTPALNETSLRALISAVIQLETPDHDWTFVFPRATDLSQGTHLISTQNAPEVLFVEDRDARADILLASGRVCFVFYKKIAQRLGFEKEHAWFRASTRAALTR